MKNHKAGCDKTKQQPTGAAEESKSGSENEYTGEKRALSWLREEQKEVIWYKFKGIYRESFNINEIL